MSPIILYSNDCPRCHVLQSKLTSKNIKYTKVSDVKEMISLGIKSVPMLKVNDNLIEFTSAVNWVNSQKEVNV